ncbi:MAG: 30S ribosomal protein S5, partial [Chloroflexota bacterium]
PLLVRFGASKVLIKPAPKGSGLIAGGGVRAVLEMAGVKDVVAKSLGSSNPANTVKATVLALSMMRSPKDVLARRQQFSQEASIGR